MNSSLRKTNIVIVGGGSAGVTTAQALSKTLDPNHVSIQLVTERSFYVWYPALLRVVVTSEGSLEKGALIPYDKVFTPEKAGEIVIGRVTSVEDGLVRLADGSQLSYDYLVLATGTVWPGPLAFPDDLDKVSQWIAQWRNKFSNAKNTVIIGGGAVGYELAGEIRHFHPEQNVTIVHSQQYPLNSRYPEKFRKYAMDKALAAGIDLVLGDRLNVPQEPYRAVVTEKGRKIPADLVIPVVGGKPNTEFLRSFDPSIITSSGTIRVRPTFCVPLANGKTNVYAVGDIIAWDEEKQLAKIASHVAVASANIIAAVKGSTAKPKEYGGFMEAIGLPLGPKGGVLHIPLLGGITLGDFMTRQMKSKTLMIEMAKKVVNYP